MKTITGGLEDNQGLSVGSFWNQRTPNFKAFSPRQFCLIFSNALKPLR